jgi:glycosyltransferase involved in cell wall biosynthesis
MTLSVIQVIGNSIVGGAESHLFDLIAGCKGRDITIEVVCPRPGPLVDRLMAAGISVTCIDMVRPRAGDDYALCPTALHRLRAHLLARQPAVVHSHLYPAHLHASVVAAEIDVPVIVSTAHTLVARPGEALLARLTPVRVIAVSRVVATVLHDAGVPRDRITHIPNGVRPDHFEVEPHEVERTRAALNLPPGPVIGTVCRLSPEKGVDLFLQAIDKVRQHVPNLTALVGGNGPERARLEALSGKLHLGDTVRWLGTRQDIPLLNRILDIFVLASTEEACSMALL